MDHVIIDCITFFAIDSPVKGKKRKLAEREEEEDESAVSSQTGALEESNREGTALERLKSRVLYDPTSEEYKTWKRQTIEQAKRELAQLAT